jgi:Na+/H+ antiporter NhaD/arsenite permease-like protein
LKIHHAVEALCYLTDGLNIAGSATIAILIGNYLPAGKAAGASLSVSNLTGTVQAPKKNSDFSDFVGKAWRYQPIVVILVVAGFLVFVRLVIDTYRHRKKRKDRHRIKRR